MSRPPFRSEDDIILEPNGLPGPITEVKPTVDALTIEMNSEVRSRDRKAHSFWSKRGETETALVPNTAIDDAARSGLAELASQRLGHSVVVRIVGSTKSASNVVKACVDRPNKRTQLHRGSKRLPGSCKEAPDVMRLLMHSRHQRLGAIVDTPTSIAKTRRPPDVREGRHHPRRAGSTHTLVRWHERNLASFLTHAWIGERLELNQAFPVFGIGNAFKEVDWGKARVDDAIGSRPSNTTL